MGLPVWLTGSRHVHFALQLVYLETGDGLEDSRDLIPLIADRRKDKKMDLGRNLQ